MDNTTRKEVIQPLGLMAAGCVLSLDLPHAFAESNKNDPGIKFGVQLNPFPIDLKRFQTFMDTLVQIKQIGYRGFESSFRNVSGQFAAPHQARRSIEQTGLTFFGIHIFLPTEKYDWVENEEEREDLSKTDLEVITPAYKAMKEAFSA